MSELVSSLLEAVSVVVAAVLAAHMTAKFASQDSRRQRWWERKAEAYNALISAIAEHIYYAEQELRRAPHRDPSEQEEKEWQERLATATREIRRALYRGAFIISAEAHAAISELFEGRRGTPPPDDYWDMLALDLAAYKEARDQINEIATRDLQLSEPRRWWRLGRRST